MRAATTNIISRFEYAHENQIKPPQTKCKLTQKEPLFPSEEESVRKSEIKGYNGGDQ